MFKGSDSPRERGSRSRRSFPATLAAGSAGVVAARSVAAGLQAPGATAQAPAAARSTGVSQAGLPKVRITKIERAGVLLENGHVTAITFSVLDVEKNQEKGDDTHGSKVIVVPFDGAALDRDLAASAPRGAPVRPLAR